MNRTMAARVGRLLALVAANTVPITSANAAGVTRPSGELIQGNAYTAL